MNESFLWIVLYVVVFLFFGFLIMIAYDKGKFSKIPTVLGIDKWQAMKAPLKLLTAGLVVLVLGLGYWFFFRSHKSEEKPKYNQTVAETFSYNQSPSPITTARKTLNIGEWSEWVDMTISTLNVWPATVEVEYECKDFNGQITVRPGKSRPGLHNWNDLTQFERVRSKDSTIVYNIETHR